MLLGLDYLGNGIGFVARFSMGRNGVCFNCQLHLWVYVTLWFYYTFYLSFSVFTSENNSNSQWSDPWGVKI